MKAAREQARQTKPEIVEAEILLTHTTYPVFNKAAHALGLKVRQLPRSAIAQIERELDVEVDGLNVQLLVRRARSGPAI